MQNSLSVKNLSVSFNGHHILDNLSFDVQRDTTLGVVGPNGSGKTVLFKSLLGIIEHDGEVEWGDDVRIGYVPQKLSIAKDLPLTVLEFLRLKGTSEQEIMKKISLVGFREGAKHEHHSMKVLDTRIGNLSGGEMQRVLLVYALLGDPNVLLLDEPTAGFDIEGEETFYELFAKLKKDKDLTILFISHDMDVIKKYSDDILKLNHEHN